MTNLKTKQMIKQRIHWLMINDKAIGRSENKLINHWATE